MAAWRNASPSPAGHLRLAACPYRDAITAIEAAGDYVQRDLLLLASRACQALLGAVAPGEDPPASFPDGHPYQPAAWIYEALAEWARSRPSSPGEQAADDERLTGKLLRAEGDPRTAAHDENRLAARLARPYRGADVLSVRLPRAAYRLGARPLQDLAKRPLLARLLLALVDHRLAGGRGLPPQAMLDAGWPGETIIAEAAANRLAVALSQLRKHDLSGIIVRHEDGHGLHPESRLRLVVA
jgi:hypothetical protein